MTGVSAVLLAAGRSLRMGAENKLLLPINGAPMVRRVSEQLLSAGVEELVVVLGHEADRVGAALPAGARPVCNPDFHEGMGRSLAVGVDAVASDADGILIALADLAWLRAASVRKLLRAFVQRPQGTSILGLCHRGRRGHPVVFDVAHRHALLECRGDEGAKALMQAKASEVGWVEADDEGVWRDVDRPEDWSLSADP